MTEPTTVYAVASGSYDDYEIDAVYADRATAEAHIAAYPHDDDPRIEEYKVWTTVRTRSTDYTFETLIGPDGVVPGYERVYNFEAWDDDIPNDIDHRITNTVIQDSIRLTSRGRDRQQVAEQHQAFIERYLNDRRAQ